MRMKGDPVWRFAGEQDWAGLGCLAELGPGPVRGCDVDVVAERPWNVTGCVEPSVEFLLAGVDGELQVGLVDCVFDVSRGFGQRGRAVEAAADLDSAGEASLGIEVRGEDGAVLVVGDRHFDVGARVGVDLYAGFGERLGVGQVVTDVSAGS